MLKKLRDVGFAALLTLIPTALLWLPFILRLESLWGIPLPTQGMATIVANFDGPLYIVIAKTLYNINQIKEMFSFPLPVEYYAAHFPLYPLLIKAVAPLVGFPYASLLITLLSSTLATYFFYQLAKGRADGKGALFLTLVFSLLPARWLVVRSVGSPEPLFVGAVLASIYFFTGKKYWLAGIFGALAQATKSPGILLFVAYALYIIVPRLKTFTFSRFTGWFRSLELKAYPVLLIPLTLVGVFFLYQQAFGDFLAYFHSGDNIHLFFPPFQIFNYSAPWVGTFWLEEVIFVYLLALLGLMKLAEKRDIMFWFTLTFLSTIFFVSHRDIVRYSLPAVPFILLAFGETLTSNKFKIIFLILIIPIYLFSLAFISQNVMPISDWRPLL